MENSRFQVSKIWAICKLVQILLIMIFYKLWTFLFNILISNSKTIVQQEVVKFPSLYNNWQTCIADICNGQNCSWPQCALNTQHGTFNLPFIAYYIKFLNRPLSDCAKKAFPIFDLQIFPTLTDYLKFGLSEKHIKFEKILLMVWTFTK